MHYQRYLRQSTYWRYGIFIVTCFFGYYAIQAYLNNINIEFSISQTKEQRLLTEEKIAFMEKFYSPYLISTDAAYFLSHENGSLYKDERIVRIKYKSLIGDTEALPTGRRTKAITLTTPQESWQYFITDKLGELKTLGVLKE